MIGPKTLVQLKFLNRRTGNSPSGVLAASVARMVEAAVGMEAIALSPMRPPHIGNV